MVFFWLEFLGLKSVLEGLKAKDEDTKDSGNLKVLSSIFKKFSLGFSQQSQATFKC
jgi:hypothetical protein